LFFSFFFSLRLSAVSGWPDRRESAESRNSAKKKFLFLSFKENPFGYVPAPAPHTIALPQDTYEKETKHTSQATWRERGCVVFCCLVFLVFLSLSTREFPLTLFAVAFYSAAVALRSYTFSLSCSPSQK
jgi:hypothetical protein